MQPLIQQCFGLRLLTIFWPWIIANLSLVSIVSFPLKSDRSFNTFLTFDYSQSIHNFNLFFSWKIQPLFQQYFGVELFLIYPYFQSFLFLKNSPGVWTIVWPWIIANLSIVSMAFLFLEIATVDSTIFWHWIIVNLSLVSIVSFPLKSDRSFQHFFGLWL